jgi:hypothetical protein
MKKLFTLASFLLLFPAFALCGHAQSVPPLESIQSQVELDKAITTSTRNSSTLITAVT